MRKRRRKKRLSAWEGLAYLIRQPPEGKAAPGHRR